MVKTGLFVVISSAILAIASGFSPILAKNAEAVHALLKAKQASGVTYTEIARKTGLTNGYVAQLFHRQAQLKDATAKKLKEAVPSLSDEVIKMMKEVPFRVYDDEIKKEPTVYRLTEAVLLYGESIKELINEEFGDGIMSAIDFKLTVDKVKGPLGEDRVVITMNGKFLPHIEQHVLPTDPATELRK